MPVSDWFSLFARMAVKASMGRTGAIALGACIAIMAIKDGSPAAPGEFAVISIPDYVVVAIPAVASRSIALKPSEAQEAIVRSPPSAPLKLVSLADLPRRQTIVAAGPAITGIASMYNPNNPYDFDAGTTETASGQSYNDEGWTAAIQTELRAQFGGVRFGRKYQAAFALVQVDNKQAIVRINDVGPLMPGRIIDLNERTMRYFDPGLRRGLLRNIQVTPLIGADWVAGPLIETARSMLPTGSSARRPRLPQPPRRSSAASPTARPRPAYCPPRSRRSRIAATGKAGRAK